MKAAEVQQKQISGMKKIVQITEFNFICKKNHRLDM